MFYQKLNLYIFDNCTKCINLILFSVTSTTGPMDPNLDLLAKHQKLDLLIERLELVTKRLENVASFAAKSQGKQILKSRCSKAEVPS